MFEINQKMPKTEKGLRTFEKIVKSAEKLFSESSYHVATIEDITKDANIASGTFYIYFKSKKALFKYLIYNYYHEIRKMLSENILPNMTRLDIERAGLKSFINYVMKKPHVYIIIYQSLVVEKDLFIDYYSSFAKRYVKQLQEAKDKKQINNDIDLTTLAYALMGLSNFVGLQVILFSETSYNKKEIDNIVDNAMIILNKGIA